MAHYKMLIDSDKCMNCKACVVGCQQRNGLVYGYQRNWVRTDLSGRHLSGKGYQPGGCMQCDEPLCVTACPTKATYKADDGVVMVDSTRCIGCGSCIESCPYDARYLDSERRIADKCDYCSTTRQLGVEPACTQLCPTKARIFGDLDDPESAVSKALVANPELVFVESPQTPTKPSLAYVGETTVTDWPREASIPASVAIMRPVSTGIRYLGGLVLLGVIGAFFKNIIWPPDGRASEQAKNPPAHASGKGE